MILGIVYDILALFSTERNHHNSRLVNDEAIIFHKSTFCVLIKIKNILIIDIRLIQHFQTFQ